MNGLFNVQQALLPGLPGQVGRIAMPWLLMSISLSQLQASYRTQPMFPL